MICYAYDMSKSEIWKPVAGYEGRYEVSNLGAVRSCPITVCRPGVTPFIHPLSGRVLKQTTVPRGYKQVMMHTGVPSERRNVRVHRLVCEAFHGPPHAEAFHVLHGDGNPGNNSADNLRWGTHDENLKDAVMHGSIGKGERHPRARLSDQDIEAIRQLKRSGLTYRQIASQYGVHWCYVQKLVLGVRRP